jgi:hypothetical protein
MPLRIGAFSAPGPTRLIEERLADLSPLLDVLQEALIDEVLVDRDPAQEKPPLCVPKT